ncbi:hypothetical protein GCM10011611_10570 [Aliidongia dinghuensis]|uniref:N-acetyltransferase domain-containing protein n=1 Tax=Aliidongia dinghuensis TaxID=1867774 RepID=A0A8J2YS17_9PROT|nr:MarR family transcriptional regulator [Aliidongia dinghuensis]GGF06965.1 hypothetical protein GCM10011611_10570 [Aliidongia dinghuensis]
MSASRRALSPVAENPVAHGPAELIALEKYRSLGGESHRVLRCLDTILASDRYEIVDTGEIARFLGIRSQAVSRALKTLVDRSIIERGTRIGRSHTFRRIEPAPAKAAVDDHLLQLDIGQTTEIEVVRGFLEANDPGFDEAALRLSLKFGMVLYLRSEGKPVAAALIDYNPAIDSGPTIARLVVERRMRALGHGRRFLMQIERHFAGKRIFAHAPVDNKELVIALLRHGFDIVGQETMDGRISLILKKGPGA